MTRLGDASPLLRESNRRRDRALLRDEMEGHLRRGVRRGRFSGAWRASRRRQMQSPWQVMGGVLTMMVGGAGAGQAAANEVSMDGLAQTILHGSLPPPSIGT